MIGQQFDNAVYTNDEGMMVIAQGFEIPSMCREFDPNPEQSWYDFFRLDFETKTIVPLKEEEVKRFYKTLKRRKERIDIWFSMKENGWVGKEEER